MKKIGDYHNLYLKTYVSLLTNVFEQLRKICPKYCGSIQVIISAVLH